MPCAASAAEAFYRISKIRGETDWNTIPQLCADRVLWLPDAGIRAFGQLCLDDEQLYIHLRAEENAIRAEHTKPMSPVCEDSCLEFFFMMPEDECYFNFEINPNGCLRAEIGRDRTDRIMLVAPFAESLFDIHTGMTSDGWEVFYQIPLSFLRIFRPEFKFSGSIRANVYKCGDLTVKPHYLAWSPIHSEQPDFHQPAFFGVMHFGE